MSTYWPPQPASDNVIRAGLRVISADHYERDGDPHADAEAEHAAELLALAARELARAVDKLPEDEQPIGWRTEQDASPQTDTTVYHLRLGMPDYDEPLHLGLYANQNAAKLHGFAEHERHHGPADLMWRHNDEDVDGVLRLFARTSDGEEMPTSWHIVPMTAAAEYDPHAEG